MNDLKFAFRQLLKNPGSTTVAVLNAAFGLHHSKAHLNPRHKVSNLPLENSGSSSRRLRVFGCIGKIRPTCANGCKPGLKPSKPPFDIIVKVKGSELTNEMFCWVMAQFFVISASPSLHPFPAP